MARQRQLPTKRLELGRWQRDRNDYVAERGEVGWKAMER